MGSEDSVMPLPVSAAATNSGPIMNTFGARKRSNTIAPPPVTATSTAKPAQLNTRAAGS